MSMESTHDPRSALVKLKYFSLHPKPLERWLWKQALPPAAERVFWLHWEAGMQNGDWCSEIPLKRVALECCIDLSTVTRAYQLLKALELIRREDPGRDPNNPFQQATAITEVQLPRELIAELAKCPNRPARAQATSVDSQFLSKAGPSPALQPVLASPHKERFTREQSQALWSRASAAERSRYFVASRDRLTSFEFDANTQLSPEDRGEILSQLAELAAARPSPSQSKLTTTTAPAPQGPRRLSVLELARIRRQIQELLPSANSPEVLRQVIWAVEQGALQRFTVKLAINIALKKIREGAWERPHRMPPNWLPRAAKLDRAQPEPCSAA
jgi:hypothetical protein